jgi:hypothetical protein
MSTFWIALAALAVVPDAGSTPPGTSTPLAVVQQESLVPPRTGAELRDAVRAAMRRWGRPDGKQSDLAAREFLVLYDELQADDQISRGQRDELLTKVRSRLQKLAEQIGKRVAVEKRLAKSQRPESVIAAVANHGVLAQMGPWGPPDQRAGAPLAGRGFGLPGLGGPGLAGGMMGGGPLGGGGGQFGDDYGPQLVDLIQQVIAPQTWDVNGGLGTAYYWRPGRALVIRQTGGVHDQLGDLLEQLGRAGR